jgi:hypothetical protein
MLAFTKQASISIAVTLGVALSMPLSMPAYSASSNRAMLNRGASALRNNLVLAKRKYVGVDDDDFLLRGPVFDFGLYYGPRIRFRQSGATLGDDTLLLVSQIKRHIA